MNRQATRNSFAPQAVHSIYRSGGRQEQHETVAITALGMRAMRRNGAGQSAQAERYLDFLESAMRGDGSFAFWPDTHRPNWANGIPPDVDDTALALLELYISGRIGREQAVRIAARTVLTQRSRPTSDLRPLWIADGCFETWLVGNNRMPGRPNIIDCTVNANVLALLAALDMTNCPGWKPAIVSIRAGLDWAGQNRVRLRSLTPFYPSIWELLSAMETAVDHGCVELADALPALRLCAPRHPDPGTAICSGAYREDGWYSNELNALRVQHEDGIK